MKPETRKIERWLRDNWYRNDFANYWYPKMREAEDKDAVAQEMLQSYESLKADLLALMEDMGHKWKAAARALIPALKQIYDAMWPMRYEDDIAEPEWEIFQ